MFLGYRRDPRRDANFGVDAKAKLLGGLYGTEPGCFPCLTCVSATAKGTPAPSIRT